MTVKAGSARNSKVTSTRQASGKELDDDRMFRSKMKVGPLDDFGGLVNAVDEIVEDGAGRYGRPHHRRSNSLGGGYLSSPGDEIVEYVVDDTDEEEVEEVLDESEYYEEIEIEDESAYYDELVEESPAVVSPETKQEIATTVTPTEEQAQDDHESSGNKPSENCTQGGGDDDEEDEDAGQDLPERSDVIEAINYIMVQEQVIKYGLVTQEQSDELNALPLAELMEIMNHFETCDNNNATIRWDLVLALVNPKYVDLDDDPSFDDEDEDADKVADLAPPAHASVSLHREDGSSSGDGFSLQSEVNVHSTDCEHASVGSGYSLDVNNWECDSSMSCNDVSDDDFTEELLEDGNDSTINQASKSNLDPRIRAMYTKSMVELERNRSLD